MKLHRDTSESEAIITLVWIGGGGAAAETFRFRSLCWPAADASSPTATSRRFCKRAGAGAGCASSSSAHSFPLPAGATPPHVPSPLKPVSPNPATGRDGALASRSFPLAHQFTRAPLPRLRTTGPSYPVPGGAARPVTTIYHGASCFSSIAFSVAPAGRFPSLPLAPAGSRSIPSRACSF
jgi:hypothetical protein